jgi:hypothetical protein
MLGKHAEANSAVQGYRLLHLTAVAWNTAVFSLVQRLFLEASYGATTFNAASAKVNALLSIVKELVIGLIYENRKYVYFFHISSEQTI